MNKYLIEKKNACRVDRARVKDYLIYSNILNIKPAKLFVSKRDPLAQYARCLIDVRREKAVRRIYTRNYKRAEWLINRHYDCYGTFITDIATAQYSRETGWGCPSSDFIIH